MKPKDSQNEADDRIESPRSAVDPGLALAQEALLTRRGTQSEVVPASGAAVDGSGADDTEHAADPLRASGVVPFGGVPGELGRLASEEEDLGEEDEATSVDVLQEALAVEQGAALARRIHSALDQTLPIGTPSPGPVEMAGRLAARATFKQTMLLGVPKFAAPGPAAVAAPVAAPGTDSSALRASFVRAVGPPTTPPPRRSRRSGLPPLDGTAFGGAEVVAPGPGSSGPERVAAPSGGGVADVADHEAFALDRPIVNPMLSAPLRAAGETGRVSSAGSPNAGSSVSGGGQVVAPFRAYREDGLMLPPPPQPADFEPPSSPALSVGISPASLGMTLPPRAPGGGPGGSRPRVPGMATPQRPAGIGAVRRPAPLPLLSDLPSVDPFAGFAAPPPSAAQRWIVVFVVALAVVGLFALGAIAFGFLGKTGW